MKEHNEIIVCPDCESGRKAPVFSVKQSVMDHLQRVLPTMDQNELKEAIISFPRKYAWVEYTDEGLRTYWSWEKEALVRSLRCDENGLIFSVRFDNRKFNDPFKSVTYQGSTYKKVNRRLVPIRLIVIPDDYPYPTDEKINREIALIQRKGTVPEIKVTRTGNLSWLLIDNYSRLLAAKSLGFKEVYVNEYVKEGARIKLSNTGEGKFLAETYIVQRNEEQYQVVLKIHRYRNGRIKKRVLLDFGSFGNLDDAHFAINLLKHTLENDEYYKQMRSLKTPHLRLRFDQKTKEIILNHGVQNTIQTVHGQQTAESYQNLYDEIKNSLDHPTMLQSVQDESLTSSELLSIN